MDRYDIDDMSVYNFSGGDEGPSPGACGLLAAVGDFKLNVLVKSAACLQYRARNGAGITIKGIYKETDCYVFHVMYRSHGKIKELENVLEKWGLQILDNHDMVPKKFYYEYDLPIIKKYYVTPPTVDEMIYREKIKEEPEYITKQVMKFNSRFMDDARIFSSSKENGTFLTAFQLEDTVRLYDIMQYEDYYYDACLIHLRWPTSRGKGLWWGPQPISLCEISGIHNGHLSSDKSNAGALEQLNIPMQVGTDSEAIFLMANYLLTKDFTLEEIEWIICRKFPQELSAMSENKRLKYLNMIHNPILGKMKMSGPATAIVLEEDIMLGFTDRDHLRSFSIGYNEKVAFLGSEQRAILSAAYYMGEELDGLYDPLAGEVVGFSIDNKNIKRLDRSWSKYGK